MTFVEKLLKNSANPIYLVTGNDHTGRRAWTYLMVSRNKLQVFRDALNSGNLRLTDYGQILESGYGDAPPDDVVSRMKREYDF